MEERLIGGEALVYCLVARDGTVLAEHAEQSGNFQNVTRVLLSRLATAAPEDPRGRERLTYLYDDYMFHHLFVPIGGDGARCVTSAGFHSRACFFVMADRNLPLKYPYMFLEDLKTLIMDREIDPQLLALAKPLELNKRLQPLLATRLRVWNAALASPGGPEASSVTSVGRVKAQISDIQDVMVSNIDRILARSEKIGLLVDKTERLCEDTVAFHRSAVTLRRRVTWRNRRWVVISTALASLLAYLILALECGPLLHQCIGG